MYNATFSLFFRFSGLPYEVKRLTLHRIFSLDGSGPSYGSPGGYGARLLKRGGGPKRERDDKVHESIIEERIQRERPCRTLFIRNIKASVMLNRTLVIYSEIRSQVRGLTPAVLLLV